MKMSRSARNLCAFFMAVLLSNAPAIAASNKMISASSVVADLSRADAEKNAQEFLNRTDVKTMLLEKGLSHDEISSRLASLSDSELRQLTVQMDQARAGGDILYVILIVVLIVFLVKRI